MKNCSMTLTEQQQRYLDYQVRQINNAHTTAQADRRPQICLFFACQGICKKQVKTTEKQGKNKFK